MLPHGKGGTYYLWKGRTYGGADRHTLLIIVKKFLPRISGGGVWKKKKPPKIFLKMVSSGSSKTGQGGKTKYSADTFDGKKKKGVRRELGIQRRSRQDLEETQQQRGSKRKRRVRERG